MPDPRDTEFIVIYQSIDRISVDIVTDAFHEAGIPFSIRIMNNVSGSSITIPASHRAQAEELLEILPIHREEKHGGGASAGEQPARPWVNKVLLIALIYIGIIFLLWYSGK